MARLVAMNYSQALFELAKEENKLDLFKRDLQQMQTVLAQSDELRTCMEHPKISKYDKKEIITKVYDGMDAYVLNFVKLLIDKSRFKYFDEICKCYFAMYNDYNNIEIAHIESASALSAQEIDSIVAMLEKKLNKTIEVQTKVNEELLAGIRIRIKDEVLDNSAATRLERLKEQVMKSTL